MFPWCIDMDMIYFAKAGLASYINPYIYVLFAYLISSESILFSNFL